MNDILLMAARAAQEQTAASLWDTMGWNWYLMLAKNVEEPEEVKLDAWKSVIDAKHANYTSKYRLYAKAQGLYARYSSQEEEAHEAKTFASDMEGWDQLNLQKIERIDGFLMFYTKSEETFEMPIADIYSQAAFKQAFTVGTTIILPTIKQTSYQKFIESLRIEKVENIGATLLEKVEEIFGTQRKRLDGMELATEKEALESVEERSFAIFNDHIYFKAQALASEVKKDLPALKLSSLFILLRDIEAVNIKHRKFNFWKYDLSANNG